MPAKHQFLSVGETYEHLRRTLMEGLHQYTTQTALRLESTDVFEIWMHPDFRHDLQRTVTPFALNEISRDMFMGIRIRTDLEIEYDHPELRCIWRWVM